MSNIKDQLNRMKSMMSYGLQTENKDTYKSVEYQKLAADGKTYGIVREGTKFYIKVSDSQKPNLLKENFDYIGGFRNRKAHEYSSYANALKNFDMKMINLKESTGNKTMMVESWNPERNEYLMVEATETMKNEISRQREIMSNAARINEGKSCSCPDCECAPEEKGCTSKKSGKGGDPYTEPVESDDMEGIKGLGKNNIGNPQKPKKGKAVKEAAEPLAWHQTGGDAQSTMNDTYLDTSHGTEIGSSAPFSEKVGTETVEEGVAMHTQGENQNSPKVGTGKVGSSEPFAKKVKSDLTEDVDDELDSEDEDFEDEGFGSEGEDFDEDLNDEDSEDEDFEDDDFDSEDDGDEFDDDFEDDDLEDDEDEFEENPEIDDLKDEISQLKDMVRTIMDKVGVSSEDESEIDFEDDDLYDDDSMEFDVESDDDFEDDDEDFDDDDFEDDDEDFDDDFEDEDDDDVEIHESRNYHKMRMMNEDRLNVFGKHPSYRKRVMTLPSNGEDENQWGRDWNDETVHGDQPYGQKIGSSAPFEVSPESIDNAIAESIKRVLGGK